MTDAKRQRVIDGRMTDRASDPDGAQVVALKESSEAHDRIQLQQSNGRSGTVKIALPLFHLIEEWLRQGIDVHFQAETDSRARTDAWTNAAEIRAFDGLMKLKTAAPERFVAERVETKCVAAVCQKLTRVSRDLCVEVAEPFFPRAVLS